MIIRFFYNLFCNFGMIDGIAFLMTVLTVSVICVLSVIIIGFCVDIIEKMEFRLLSFLFNSKTAFLFCNYITWPGVVVHELAHALFALLTGADVQEISFHDSEKSGRLGHVSYYTRGGYFRRLFQQSLTSCAPVIVGGFLVCCLLYALFYQIQSVIITVLVWYLLVSVFNHMSMSRTDIINYIKAVFLLIPFMFFIIAVIALFILV